MSVSIIRISYEGIPTPGIGATAVFLDTTANSAYGRKLFSSHGLARFVLDVKHDQPFTLRAWKSDDLGGTWYQMSDLSIAVPSLSTTVRDFLVEGYEDFRIEALNGGTAQTVWNVTLWGTSDRSPAA